MASLRKAKCPKNLSRRYPGSSQIPNGMSELGSKSERKRRNASACVPNLIYNRRARDRAESYDHAPGFGRLFVLSPQDGPFAPYHHPSELLQMGCSSLGPVEFN